MHDYQKLNLVIVRAILNERPDDFSSICQSDGVDLIMRLTASQIDFIRQLTAQLAGDRAQVRVFGSRLDDTAKGGDLDLLLELPEPVENPAVLAALMSAKVSRKMYGRKVDVLISAPNLKKLAIHEIGHREGKLL